MRAPQQRDRWRLDGTSNQEEKEVGTVGQPSTMPLGDGFPPVPDECRADLAACRYSEPSLLFGSCRIGHPIYVEYRLPWEAESSSAARQLVSVFAEDRLPEMEAYELVLMVSEVVTNAVQHGSPEADGNIGLRIEEDQDVLRVVVTDGGHDFAFDPGSIEDSDRNEHFGLLLVDRLADRWGFSLDGETAIWLEVDTPRSH